MKETMVLSQILLLALAAEAGDSSAERVNSRTYPSVFQAWSPADNLREGRLENMARHDLVWVGPGQLGLRWVVDRTRGETTGLSTGFSKESIEKARRNRAELLRLNPKLVIIFELRYRDAPPDWFPPEHEWWLRDKSGKPMKGWFSHGMKAHFLQMDFTNPSYQEFLGRRARNLMETGVCDGVLLDWWHEEEHRVLLVQRIRKALGEDALIIVNTNRSTCPRSAPYVNGLFMETCLQGLAAKGWEEAARTLLWAERSLRKPRANCMEIWWKEPLRRKDLKEMRATTTLVLTHSNGYCLFSDPNPLPTGDHRHDWYPFWEKSLGSPKAPMEKRQDGAFRREFEKGTVIFNPPGNDSVAVRFEEVRFSRATGKSDQEHRVEAGDGDLFLREPVNSSPSAHRSR